MKQRTICFIRHGETEWNNLTRTQGTTDIPLNETGISQAHAAAELVTSSPWDAVYTSPLKRAASTAHIIQTHLGLPEPWVRVALMERHFGIAEGMTSAERRTRYATSDEIPGAEPKLAVRARGLTVIEEILADRRLEHVLIVTHGGTIMALLDHLVPRDLPPDITHLHNAGATYIHWDGEIWSLGLFNQTTLLHFSKNPVESPK
jgi:probable phosphoglycerate mutase